MGDRQPRAPWRLPGSTCSPPRSACATENRPVGTASCVFSDVPSGWLLSRRVIRSVPSVLSLPGFLLSTCRSICHRLPPAPFLPACGTVNTGRRFAFGGLYIVLLPCKRDCTDPAGEQAQGAVLAFVLEARCSEMTSHSVLRNSGVAPRALCQAGTALLTYRQGTVTKSSACARALHGTYKGALGGSTHASQPRCSPHATKPWHVSPCAHRCTERF